MKVSAFVYRALLSSPPPAPVNQMNLSNPSLPPPFEGDIVITGHFFPGLQKMWTFVVYGENGLPHHHNFNDETIFSTPTDTTIPSSKSGHNRKEGGEGGNVTAQSYRVVLTMDPSRLPQGRENVVDVSKLPRGAVILRLIYPKTKEVFDQSKPAVKVVRMQKRGSSKKEA